MKKRSLIALLLVVGMLAVVLTGCGDSDKKPAGNTSETTESDNTPAEYTNRVILISDVHYMPNETPSQYKALHPTSIPSDAIGPTFGYTQTEKMEAIRNDLAVVMNKEKVDAVLVLGDLGTDDYGYRKMADNYGLKFKEEVMDTLSCKAYAIPGNHDSYPNDLWKEMFGYDRQYSIEVGDSVFMMLDTYNDYPAKSASGSKYTGIDTDWLEKEIKKYPNKKIFLCGHYYEMDSLDKDFAFNRIMSQNKQIVCMFRGHTHMSKLFFNEKWNKKYLADLGGYAYKGEKVGGGYTFNNYYENYAWGYSVLEWNDTEAHYYHLKFPRTYKGDNGTFDFVGAMEDDITIKLK